MSSPNPVPKKPTLFSILGRGILSVFSFLGKTLVFLLGSVKYQWPWWITPGIPKLARLVGRSARSWVDLGKGAWWTRGLKAVTLTIALAALGFGVFTLVQDRSSWTNFEVTAPTPTPLVKDATYSVLRVKFSSSAARVDLADKTVGEGIVLEPAMKGSWKWQGDDELIFSPSEDWTCDTGYRVTLAPSLFADGLKLP